MTICSGKVLEGYGSSYHVFYRERLISCVLRGKFRQTLKETHNPIAVGDSVKFSILEDGSGVIEELMERKNKISRPTKWGPSKEKVIVSNVDQLIAVVSVKNPPLKTGLIDRMLVVTEREGIKGVICINKSDLIDVAEIDDIIAEYRKLRFRVFPVSALTGEGVDELRSALEEKFSVFMGQSGVGKTSLLNRLQPGIDRRVREISEASDKGKHTTSHVSAVYTDFNALIVDTPGFRSFGIWGVEKGNIDVMFREFRRYIDNCRFRPCSHTHEPGCAVQDAVEQGKIAAFRYENYVRIYESYSEEVDPFN
ncbi:ribosome small subunit-dependent GTPase A [candidate division KSB1 bacterium]